tara:strand:- start:656 stop:1105 length:450 start_codon:yes stop_codon:yes gene_type:complete
LEIYVDGDACPVKDEVIRVAERHGLTIHLVGNTWLRAGDSLLINRVVVGDQLDAADDWIAERCGCGDIVITGDIPLAGRCLKTGAMAINHNGKAFTPDSIGMTLATRDLMTHLRETGKISGGGPDFTKQDRSRFLQALENAIQALKRKA